MRSIFNVFRGGGGNSGSNNSSNNNSSKQRNKTTSEDMTRIDDLFPDKKKKPLQMTRESSKKGWITNSHSTQSNTESNHHSNHPSMEDASSRSSIDLVRRSMKVPHNPLLRVTSVKVPPHSSRKDSSSVTGVDSPLRGSEATYDSLSQKSPAPSHYPSDDIGMYVNKDEYNDIVARKLEKRKLQLKILEEQSKLDLYILTRSSSSSPDKLSIVGMMDVLRESDTLSFDDTVYSNENTSNKLSTGRSIGSELDSTKSLQQLYEMNATKAELFTSTSSRHPASELQTKVKEFIINRRMREVFVDYMKSYLNSEFVQFQGVSTALFMGDDDIFERAVEIISRFFILTTTTEEERKSKAMESLKSGKGFCQEDSMLQLMSKIERIYQHIVKMAIMTALIKFITESTEYTQACTQISSFVPLINSSRNSPIMSHSARAYKSEDISQTGNDNNYHNKIKQFRESRRIRLSQMSSVHSPFSSRNLNLDGSPLFPRLESSSASGASTVAATSSSSTTATTTIATSGLSSGTNSGSSSTKPSDESIHDTNGQSLSNRCKSTFESGVLNACLRSDRWLTELVTVFNDIPVSITIASALPDQFGFPLIYANNMFLQSCGYEKTEVLGKNCRFLQNELTDVATIEKIQTALRDAQPLWIDVINASKDGESFRHLLALKPIRDQFDQYRYVVGCHFALSDNHNQQFNQAHVWLLDQIYKMIPPVMFSYPEEESKIIKYMR